ncbi:uncharacterized protein LOC120090654 [Benincasa hispida]|uniref:uncharacterized protein LOC120090654 n=1 Tax=Benincasa hispida TaxID=102211 RepID=UPI0019003CB8|nr:uncharacterized protein LOC120090654 [Benincasa hispida]
MTLQRARLIFDGRWDENSQYHDFRDCEIGYANSNLVCIVEDKDILWLIYDKAWKGCEIALNSLRGTLESSYAGLSPFLAALIENNPVTCTTQESDDEGRIKYYFMALAASIESKNKVFGILLSACTFDGNSHIVPLVFVIVDYENDASWSWFFRNLKVVFGDSNDHVVVSDDHKSIAKSVSSVYDFAEHELCAFHLYKNLVKIHKSRSIEDTFHMCVRAYTIGEFEYYIRKLDEVASSIRLELEEVGKSKWARAFCRRKRYSLMTTNISECMNSALKEALELPVIGLLESIHSLVQKWFYKRRSHWSF